MAAALNWVIKDGMGQLGGVLFASFINTRFDADPKRFVFPVRSKQKQNENKRRAK